MSVPSRILGSILDWAYPRVCIACNALSGKDGGGALCALCRAKLRPIDGPVCARCGLPVNEYLDTEKGCGLCRSTKFNFDTAAAAGLYEGVLRDMICALKYTRRRDLVPELSGFFQGAVKDRLPGGVEVVVPVPLFHAKRRDRGFNQAEFMARPLASALGVRLDTRRLVRKRATRSQVGLSAAARRRNLEGAFSAPPHSFDGLSVLLVDDVMTTGSTGSECARVLKAAGARNVRFAVVARHGRE